MKTEFIGEKILLALWDRYSLQNFVFPLSRLFKQVLDFDPKQTRIAYGQEEMNKKFLEMVKKEKPDYILFNFISDEFKLEIFEDIRILSPKTKLINFSGDDDFQYESFTRYLSLFLDAQIIYQKDFLRNYLKEGFVNTFASIGINLNHYRPLNLTKKHDVSFIGVPRNDRAVFIRYLLENNVNVRIWGAGWEKYPEFNNIFGGYLSSVELVKVINESKINLCFNKGGLGTKSYHLTGRVFEIAACKSFQLVEYYEGYLDLFKNEKEIIMFKNKEDLLKKIKEYLGDEKRRDKIAGQAYNRVINYYNRIDELKKIFKKLSNLNTYNYPNLAAFEDSVALITKNDWKSGLGFIKEKINDRQFIHFNLENSKFSKYKEFLQAYSLKISHKQISCCDYYVNNGVLEDYLLFKTKNSFYNNSKKYFNNLLSPDQIMVTKEYFVKNLPKFKRMFFKNKIDFVEEENLTILSFPLVRIKMLRVCNNDIMNKSFEPKFIHYLSSNLNNNKFSFIYYLNNLILLAILQRNFFIFYSLWKYLKKVYLLATIN